MKLRSIVRRAVAVFVLAGAGCSSDAPPANTIVTPEPVTRVDVSPNVVSLVTGATSQLSATVIGSRGNVLSGRTVSWTSSDLAVATVNSSGLVSGVAIGSATISASADGIAGTASVSVTRPQVASIAVTPDDLTMVVGSTIQLSAAALGTAGDTLPGRTFSYSSSNTAVATVSTAGLVSAVATGTASITVSAEGQTRAVPVTVRATSSGAVASILLAPLNGTVVAGSSLQLSVAALDANDVVLAGKVFAFTTSNATVAAVSSTGLVTGVAVGQATITATSEGKQATATIVVTSPGTGPGPVARVTLSPGQLSIPAGRQDQLTAVAYDASGVAVPTATYTFQSSAASVATVSATGLVTAVGAGTATVTVTSAGRTDVSTITVTAAANGTITRVDITPPATTVAVGATVQLTGAAYDAQGRVTTKEAYLWSVNNPVIASVSQTGLVTGLAPGVATVTMSSGGFVKSAAVTVTSSIALTNVIDVQPALRFQTMAGWQGGGQNGWQECNQTAFANYKNQLHDRLINELGIERVTIPLRSGTENTRDYFSDFLAGVIDQTAFRATWYAPVNDNANALVTDSAKFFWSFLDGYIDNAVLPLRQRMLARGEQLFLVLTYVDFDQDNVVKPFLQMKTPEEYAELITMAFKHMQAKYGFVPSAYELVLEPEHTSYNATDVGRALVATTARLRAAGFNPEVFGPSTTSMYNASTWYDQMMLVPGARGLLSELAYHRYTFVSYPALAAIGLRSVRDGVKSSMLEHIGSGFDDLYEDITVGNVSSWMQYSNAFCGNRDNPDNNGVYYQINQTDPANPKVNITNDSKLFRQLFNYVRRGAVRIGATSGNSTDLLPLAFRNVNGRHVVVVRAKRAAAFSVRGLPAGTYGINFGTPGTQWNVSLADQTISSGGTIQTSIPGDGVITIYGK